MALFNKNTSMGKSSRIAMQDEMQPPSANEQLANPAADADENLAPDEQASTEEPGEN